VVVGVQALHQGLWLGLLDGPALQAATARFYASEGRYTSTYHNNAGFLGWEAALIDRHFGNCRTILVGAAGGGREVVALLRRGVTVDAFDCAPTLVASTERVLMEQGLKARIQLAPADVVPDGLGTYDGVILGCGAYSHVVGQPTRVRLLRALTRHLRPAGPLLFSFQTRPADPAAQRLHRWIHATARAVRAVRRSRASLELGDTLPGYFSHRFVRPEIEAEAAAAGLSIEHYGELEYGVALARAAPLDRQGLTGRPPSGDRRRFRRAARPHVVPRGVGRVASAQHAPPLPGKEATP
jgi:SAM-dependent methyltransferase